MPRTRARKKATPARPRNPQDATRRNVQAANRKLAALHDHVVTLVKCLASHARATHKEFALLRAQIVRLERRLATLSEPTGGAY